MGRDWEAEIDRWTEVFRDEPEPPAVFRAALAGGWDPAARRQLASDAAEYAAEQDAYVAQIRAAGVDLVRLDFKEGCCSFCARWEGKPFSLTGEAEGLPPPPPLPMCPGCRPMLNLLTPYFMQSLGLDADDLAADALPYASPVADD
jgi:hypothetical protein